LALRVTRLGLVVVGICCRSPPGLKPHARRGERRGHRVRGLWCYERADPGRPQRSLGRTPNTKLCARQPCHVVTRKTVAGHSPAPVRLMSSAAPGLISGRCSARRAGQHSAVLPRCGSASGRAARSVRGFVRSSVRPVGPPSSTVARSRRARDLTSKLANDDRDGDREGVYGFESLSPAPAQFAADAVLTAYTLMACGRGRGRALHRPRNGNPVEPLVTGPPLSASRRSGDRRLWVRRSGRGSQDRALPPHSSLPDGPACGRTPPVVKTRGRS